MRKALLNGGVILATAVIELVLDGMLPGGGLAAGSPTGDEPTSPTNRLEKVDGRPNWRHVAQARLPSPRSQALVVYAPDRQKVIMFGGFLENRDYCAETWEFDGRKWKRINASGPAADPGYMMAYDIRRGVAVLFGGRRRQTWEFDGSTWKRIDCKHKPPITGYGAVAYDPNHQVVVLFGGETVATATSRFPSLSGETWQYDGTDWAMVAEHGPSPRKYHRMVYDSARERFVLFGGFDGKRLNDTWELRKTGWRQVHTSVSPPPRRGFAMTYDPAARCTVLFGGYPGGSELWIFDGANWQQIATAQSPPFREGASLVFVPTAGKVLLFGGLSTRLLDDCWELTLGRWKPTLQVPPPMPAVEATASPELQPVPGTIGEPLVPPIPPISTRPEPARGPSVPSAPPLTASLRIEGFAIYPRRIDPDRVISFTGRVRNTGATTATCRLEFWLSRQREPFVGEAMLCRPEKLQLGPGQSFDLSQLLRMMAEGLASGEYYVGLEIDRTDSAEGRCDVGNILVVSSAVSIIAE